MRNTKNHAKYQGNSHFMIKREAIETNAEPSWVSRRRSATRGAGGNVSRRRSATRGAGGNVSRRRSATRGAGGNVSRRRSATRGAGGNVSRRRSATSRVARSQTSAECDMVALVYPKHQAPHPGVLSFTLGLTTIDTSHSAKN